VFSYVKKLLFKAQIMTIKDQPRLEVYLNRSVLVERDGDERLFLEGSPTPEAKARLEKIKNELAGGFLKNTVTYCIDPAASMPVLEPAH
jgi:hypothetical protein